MPIDDRLNPDETVMAEEEGQKKKSGKKMSWLIYLIIAVAMVGGGYFAGVKFLKSSETASAENETHEKKAGPGSCRSRSVSRSVPKRLSPSSKNGKRSSRMP